MQIPQAHERVFRAERKLSSNPTVWLLGGLAAFGAAAVGFVVVVLTGGGVIRQQLLTTLPVLVGIGAIVTSRTLAGSPHKVGVGAVGVRFAAGRKVRKYLWQEIGWSTIQGSGLMAGHRRHLLLYDTTGRSIAKLSDALEGFDEMAELIGAYIAAKGDAIAEQIQLRKARRNAVFVGSMAAVFVALSAFVAWTTRQELEGARRLVETGIEADAVIEDRRLAPNGVTPRLIYTVTTPDGRSAEHNAELERPVWDALEGAETVRVRYVPGEPELARLVIGEVRDDPFEQQLTGYGLPAALGVLCLFFLASAVLMWKGWDIDLDSKTGKVSIKRFGSGR